MATDREPTMRAAWLGEELRTLRESRKIAAKDIGVYLGKSQPGVSRLESGLYPAQEKDVKAYLDLCGVTDARRRGDLFTMCEDVGQRGWWDGYSADIAPTLMDRMWVEARALDIQVCDLTYIPSLLQTPEYAGALLRIGDKDVKEREIARWLEFRMTRQHIVTRHHPVELRCLFDEFVFDRITGGIDVMKGQLDYLLEAATRPNITLQVMPARRQLSVNGPFEVLKLQTPYPKVGFVASSVGDLCVEGEEVNRLIETYDRLVQASLSPAESVKLIKAKRDQL